MSNFDKLMKDPVVANHPLIKGSTRKWSDTDYQGLNDIFSTNNPYKKESIKDLTNIVKDATLCVQNVMNQFDVPRLPQVRFINHKDTKYASNDKTRIVSSILTFDVDFMTLTGVKRTASVPVVVRESGVIQPSVMYVNGSVEVISQSVVDNMIGRATSYSLPPVREGHDPLMNLQERAMATEVRNERGWIENGRNYQNYMLRKGGQKKSEVDAGTDDLWTKEGYELFLENTATDVWDRMIDYMSREGGTTTIDDAWAWMVENGEVLDSGTQRQVNMHVGTMEAIENFSDNFNGDYYEAVVADIDPYLAEYEKDGLERRAKTSKKAGLLVPSAYSLVVEDMKKAEKEGKDTFPRAYHHLMRNYILNHVSTANKDQWMVHLINDGYCLNPYGKNMRTRRAFKSWKEFDKFAQEIEKDIEMEVTGDPVEVDSMYYPGTKTPIEISDGVRFTGSGGNIKGTVVDVLGDSLIVKSKGMEYRVPVEEVEPLPSTFRKMYM